MDAQAPPLARAGSPGDAPEEEPGPDYGADPVYEERGGRRRRPGGADALGVRVRLQSSCFTGIRYAKVELLRGRRVRLWDLVVRGRAWRVGASREKQLVCRQCGRLRFQELPMVVDVKQWDGSDFFNVDGNPNIIVVTEAVREVLLGIDNVCMRALE